MHTEIRNQEEEFEMTAPTRGGFAILLPNGKLWREPIHIAEAPDSSAPDLWPTRERAQEALRNLMQAVIDLYGPTSYSPSVIQWTPASSKVVAR
ncbi:hypothetical protein OHB26_39270 (plasmid) [Nocardia sp. NBC_01503]|uniref:hypothetical protein n=1 Tax=Nocardia sp. NBC_01503 TaxID=2975997 RepID=UPI002E7BFF73|nr:hypothetical protein [Nocardia sp. NBC_01503]WTL36720.1 hypothetical protein OHB26_39270 [Nocardia sp. NBC_01503]